MTLENATDRRSAFVMRLFGWGLLVGWTVAAIYPAGFLWGVTPTTFPFICGRHPASPLDGLHPYLFMMLTLYAAWAILMIRGAKDPKANAGLFDFGILANALHAAAMIPMAFLYPGEHAHLWTDVPLLSAIALALWISHPNRAPRIGQKPGKCTAVAAN